MSAFRVGQRSPAFLLRADPSLCALHCGIRVRLIPTVSAAIGYKPGAPGDAGAEHKETHPALLRKRYMQADVGSEFCEQTGLRAVLNGAIISHKRAEHLLHFIQHVLQIRIIVACDLTVP